MPSIFDTTLGEFLELIDLHPKSKIVVKKQLHINNSRYQERTNRNNDKYELPFKPHIDKKRMYNSETKRWVYYIQNMRTAMLSYHASLLVWGAHLNWQPRMATYSLKYTMQCEPHNFIVLNKKCYTIGTSIRICCTIQIYIVSYNTLSSITFGSAACVLANTDCLKRIVIKYINSKHYNKNKTRSKVLGFHPIEIYCDKPYECEDKTIIDYFEKFKMKKNTLT